MKPVNVLKHLATCATQLHAELQNWAEERSLVWPKGHLDSLLVFGQFMQRIAATGVRNYIYIYSGGAFLHS